MRRFEGGGDTQHDVFVARFGTEHLQKEKAERGSCCTYREAAGRSGTAGVVRSGAAAALCHQPRVRDFLRSHGTYRLSRHGHDRGCFPRQGHKFDLVTGASRMDHHNPVDVPPVIPVPAGSASEQQVQFLNHRSTPGTA
jgi:hypothetical protein